MRNTSPALPLAAQVVCGIHTRLFSQKLAAIPPGKPVVAVVDGDPNTANCLQTGPWSLYTCTSDVFVHSCHLHLFVYEKHSALNQRPTIVYLRVRQLRHRLLLAARFFPGNTQLSNAAGNDSDAIEQDNLQHTLPWEPSATTPTLSNPHRLDCYANPLISTNIYPVDHHPISR